MVESKMIFGDYEKCKSPILSILIPTYRGSDYLLQAIDSAINQAHDICYEVIVVSNDPSNDFLDIRQRYKNASNLFIYQNSENIGMVGNSNRCVELARGRYIAFLHDDDYLLDNYMSVFKEYIMNNQNIKCLITGRYVEFEGKEKKSLRIKKILRTIYFVPDLYRKKLKKITLNNCLRSGTNIYLSPSCGTIIEKDAFVAIGGFDDKIVYSFDFDFFLRFNAIYDVYEVTEECSVYRIGDNASLKSNVKYEFFDYFRSGFMEIMKKNKVDEKYLEKNRKQLIYTVYKQLGKGLDDELKDKQEVVETVGVVRMALYRFMTTMYFYNHNLDIQRLRK